MTTIEDSIEHCRYCRAAKTRKRNKIRYGALTFHTWDWDYARAYYSYMPEVCGWHRQALKETTNG